jgi:hypothetical protein
MNEACGDRRNRFFARMADLHRLTDRGETTPARRSGAAADGRKWMLTEVARLLLEDDRFFIGYHKSKVAESSHLLYVVSGLHVRWLADN